MGGFGPGLYRLFNYDGTLIDKGLKLGTVPGGSSSASGISIQTAVNKQVNLINNIGIKAGFWDGGDLAHADNHAINGGNGVWNLVNDNWTDGNGALNAPWRNGTFAIFAGQAGVVTTQGAAGAIATGECNSRPMAIWFRGCDSACDGRWNHAHHSRGSGAKATLATELRGTQGLDKTDFGALVFTGENSYSGVTTVRDGTLQLGDGGTSGSIRGDVVVGSHAYGPGTLAIDRSDELVLRGAISGGGRVVQRGRRECLRRQQYLFRRTDRREWHGEGRDREQRFRLRPVEGVGRRSGGSCQFWCDGWRPGRGRQCLARTGHLTLEQNSASIFSGAMSGKGGLIKNGSGRLTLAGVSSYAGATVVNRGALIQGAQGALSAASAYWVDRGQRCGWAASIQAWPRSTMQAWSHLAVAAARRFRWRATMSATTARLSSTRYWAMTTRKPTC